MGKQAKPTTSTNQPPAWVQGAQMNALSTGQNVLQPYFAQGNWNPDQAAAFQQVRDYAQNPSQVAFSPMTAATGQAATSEAALAGPAAQAQAAQAAGAQLDPNAYHAFLNPYTQSVVNSTLKNARADQAQQLNQIRARQASSSSFGGSGSRAALETATARDAFNRTNESTIAQLMAQGYDRATASALANAQMQQQTNLANAGYQQQTGLANAQLQQQQSQFNAGNQQQTNLANQSAQQQANMGNAGYQQAANLFNATGLNDTSRFNIQQQQQALQQLLGIGNYQYGQPMEALKVLGALTPQQYGSTTTTSAPQGPSTLQQLLGVGLALGGAPMTGGGSLFGLLGNSLFGGSKGATT
jgi:hypothetical protein